MLLLHRKTAAADENRALKYDSSTVNTQS